MALFVTAYSMKYNQYSMFRLVDSITGQVKDISADEIYKQLASPKSKLKIEHLELDCLNNKYVWHGQDNSRICIIDENGNSLVNDDGLIVTAVDGVNCNVANYKGQILKVHILTLYCNIRLKKYVLTNAQFTDKGQLVINK